MSTLASVFGYGLLSARAAAAVAGRFYYATDTQVMYRDNGSTWDTMTFAASLTNPMTTAGDIIVGGASGAPARLAAGTLGYPLVGGGAGVASAYAVAAKFHGVRVTDANAQSVNDSTDTAMTSNDAEVYDTDAYHDTVTNNTRFTVGTGLGGYYHVGAECFFTASALGLRQVQLWKNGTTQIALWRTPLGNATNATEIQVSCDTALVATDYVECRVQQGSGGALNVFLSGFWMHLIGTT